MDAGGRARRSGSALGSLLVLLPALAACAALHGLPLLVLAPNRLAPGRPLAASDLGSVGLAGLTGLILIAGALLLVPGRRWRLAAAVGALAAATAALALVADGVGTSAAALLAGRPPAARAILGSGAWVVAGAVLLLALEAVRRLPIPAGGTILVVALLALTVSAGRAGSFDALSLAAEYRARSGILQAAGLRHLALAAGALLLALLSAVPLGLLRFRGGRLGATVDAVLNGVQVVPALALFGALVAGLSALLHLVPGLRDLGLSAIGPTPALVATAAYLLLPLVRSIAAGLDASEESVIDTGRAMGMTPAGVLLRLRLPLGLPILLGGLRVAAVQSIGLTTLGGLVGAGGLGAVVFEGMSQFAPDLILLGAAPVIGLSLVADRLLRLAEAGAEAAT